MMTFLESSATKVIFASIALDLLTALGPMLSQHRIDPWALGVVLAKSAALLIGNALRPDINAPGFNWFNAKEPKG